MKKSFLNFLWTAVAVSILATSLLSIPAFARLADDDEIIPYQMSKSIVYPDELEKGADESYTPEYSKITCVVVSPDGNDSGKGTIASPFKTLEKARDTARASSAESVTVVLRGGKYYRTETFTLDERDSGDSYIGYKDEVPEITAYKPYSLASAAKVTDEKILASFGNSSKAGKLYSVNLWNLCPDMKPADIPSNRTPISFKIATNRVERNLRMSQYPSDGSFLTITEKTGDYSFKVDDTEGRLSDLKHLGADIMGSTPYWIGGYPGNDWSYYTAGATIDFDNGCEIEDKTKQSHYGINVGQRVFFYNIISQITDSFSYALDKDRNLYFALDDDEIPAESELFINTYNGNLVEITGDNITFFGTLFSGVNNGSAIKAETNGLTLDSCGFTDIQYGTAVVIEGNNNHVIDALFNGLGSGGLSMSGGDIETMTPSGNVVYGTEFSAWALMNRTYSPAVALYGVGGRICYNEFSNSPHLAVYLEGCNHTVENNCFDEVCYETSDAGAIYSGRSYFNRGNIIRYNLFQDIKRPENATSGYCSAVYQDDCGSSFNVYGNKFINCDRAFLFGGGRDNIFEKNLLINCGDGEETPYSGDLDARGIIWGNNPAGFDGQADKKYLSGQYVKHFPEVQGLWDDGDKFFYPVNNVIKDNILLCSAEFKIDPTAAEYGTVENNIITNDTSIVQNYENKEYDPISEKIDAIIKGFPGLLNRECGYIFKEPTDETVLLRAVNKVDEKIAALPGAADVTEGHKQQITEARQAFNRLIAEQKVRVKDLDRLAAAENALKGYLKTTEDILITDCEQLDGWSASSGISGELWNVGAPEGQAYFAAVGKGNCSSTFTFEPKDLTGAERIKLYIYVVDPDDLKAIRLSSANGSVSVGGLENIKGTVGGWLEINPEIDYSTVTENFDIKNVTSITLDSEVTTDQVTLIAYDCIRVVVRHRPLPSVPSGDIDDDGDTTVHDALTALQYSVRKTELTSDQIERGDMNTDGKVSAVDAMLILKESVKAA